jgi:metal-responsive CopG/Arc/MetJ family transcriptional regulator
MKTKLTISIDKELLQNFDDKCDRFAVNKSKLLSQMIKNWCDWAIKGSNEIIKEK